METVRGYIDRISFRNEENGYTVMVLITESGELTCVGNARSFGAGEDAELEGEYSEHPVYGKQFKFSAISFIPPESKVAVLRYLGSGAIKGIGPKMAQRIVEKFGDDSFRIIENEPERLEEISQVAAFAKDGKQFCGMPDENDPDYERKLENHKKIKRK